MSNLTRAGLVSLAAAALSAAGLGAAIAQESENRCVTVRAINGYTVIDDRHLVLNANVNDHYLVTTRSRCAGMRFGAQIGVTFADNTRLCPPFLEYVIPDDGWRCPIDTIEAVETVDAARALVEERNAAEETNG